MVSIPLPTETDTLGTSRTACKFGCVLVRFDLTSQRFHGEGTLYFNNAGTYNAIWKEGVSLSGDYTFSDGLKFSDPEKWNYCTTDRRFATEINDGIKPGSTDSQITNNHPPQPIPAGCYDTGDGIYNPETGLIEEYSGRFLRRADTDEAKWIVANCRIGR